MNQGEERSLFILLYRHLSLFLRISLISLSSRPASFLSLFLCLLKWLTNTEERKKEKKERRERIFLLHSLSTLRFLSMVFFFLSQHASSFLSSSSDVYTPISIRSLYIHLHLHIYIYIYPHICIEVCVGLYAPLDDCISLSITSQHVCVYARVCMCTSVRVYLHRYTMRKKSFQCMHMRDGERRQENRWMEARKEFPFPVFVSLHFTQIDKIHTRHFITAN